MRRSVMVGCLGLVVLAGMFAASVFAQQVKRGQKQAARGNKPNQVAADANGNAAAVQMLLQQFDRNGNKVLDGEELVQVAAALQQLTMARVAENGAGMGGMQGGGGQGFGNQGGGGRGFGAVGQGFGAAGQGFGQGNGGNQQAFQHRFQRGQGGAGGQGVGGGGGGGRGAGGGGNGGR